MGVIRNSRKVIDLEEFYKEARDKENIEESVEMIESGLKNGLDEAVVLDDFGLDDSYLTYLLQNLVDYKIGEDLPDAKALALIGMCKKVSKLEGLFHAFHSQIYVDLGALLYRAIDDGKILRFPKGFDSLPNLRYCAIRTVGKGRDRYFIAGKEELLQTYASNKSCMIDVKDLLQSALYTGRIITFDKRNFCGACDSLDGLGLNYQTLIFQNIGSDIPDTYYIAWSQGILDKNEDLLRSFYYFWYFEWSYFIEYEEIYKAF